MKKITILGAGISGLATAYWLNKEGYDVTILEAKSAPGGAMETSKKDGYLIDFGPNSGLETTPLISQLANEVGLADEMIYANEESSKRYILRNGKLHALPLGPGSFLKTKLFSAKAKARLMAEPFIGKSDDGYYQSIAQFVTRRLGEEFYDYAIDPFVSGVFAGDPEKLSVKSAFPKLYRLEEIYGGLIKGMIKGKKERKQRAEESKQSAKMFSFINGMQSFPKAIAKKLKDNIEYKCSIEKITKTKTGYKITYKQDGKRRELSTNVLISTIPAFVLSPIVKEIDAKLSEYLEQIYYPPVMVLYLGFAKKDIKRELDGFGYLIPSKEKRKFLGAIWTSTIFPNRAKDDYASFTLFVGGARNSHLFAENEKMLQKVVLDQFKEIMGITVEPAFLKKKLWEKAIPQYNLGYIEYENYFDKFEKKHPGFFLSGNYRGGISVGDCVKNSELVADKVKSYLK